MFRANLPYTTPIELYIPTLTTSKGVTKKVFDKGIRLNCSFKSYGGTEITTNGVYTVENTAWIETWYRPDITSDCRIKVGNVMYEILGEPENIDMRNQFLKFRVKAIRGNA